MMIALQRVYNEMSYIVYMMMGPIVHTMMFLTLCIYDDGIKRVYNEVSYIVYMMMAFNVYTMRCHTLCI